MAHLTTATGFSGEAILPVQFFPGPLASPEMRLLFAVLEDGLHVLRRYGASPRLRKRRIFTETVAWLLSDDLSWPFSFVNACQGLGIDAGWLRARMLPHVAPHPVPPEVPRTTHFAQAAAG
ncbi:MAG TPA: hypothetical protein VKW76_04270 [Candidatus Binatia bacterium]|nr:hypothetical protein [Candidatus Binatia bacterium]